MQTYDSLLLKNVQRCGSWSSELARRGMSPQILISWPDGAPGGSPVVQVADAMATRETTAATLRAIADSLDRPHVVRPGPAMAFPQTPQLPAGGYTLGQAPADDTPPGESSR